MNVRVRVAAGSPAGRPLSRAPSLPLQGTHGAAGPTRRSASSGLGAAQPHSGPRLGCPAAAGACWKARPRDPNLLQGRPSPPAPRDPPPAAPTAAGPAAPSARSRASPAWTTRDPAPRPRARRPLTWRRARRLAPPRPSQPPFPIRAGRPAPELPIREEAALRHRLTDQSKVSLLSGGGACLGASSLPIGGRPQV